MLPSANLHRMRHTEEDLSLAHGDFGPRVMEKTRLILLLLLFLGAAILGVIGVDPAFHLFKIALCASIGWWLIGCLLAGTFISHFGKLKDPRWTKKRDRILVGAHSNCDHCGCLATDLLVVGKFSGLENPDWTLPDRDFACLCGPCRKAIVEQDSSPSSYAIKESSSERAPGQTKEQTCTQQ
jgi:hypothetical protein